MQSLKYYHQRVQPSLLRTKYNTIPRYYFDFQQEGAHYMTRTELYYRFLEVLHEPRMSRIVQCWVDNCPREDHRSVEQYARFLAQITYEGLGFENDVYNFLEELGLQYNHPTYEEDKVGVDVYIEGQPYQIKSHSYTWDKHNAKFPVLHEDNYKDVIRRINR